MAKSQGRIARFDCLSVRKETKTKELASELARLLTKEHGHRVSRPDAVHAAIQRAVEGIKAANREEANMKLNRELNSGWRQ